MNWLSAGNQLGTKLFFSDVLVTSFYTPFYISDSENLLKSVPHELTIPQLVNDNGKVLGMRLLITQDSGSFRIFFSFSILIE